MAQAKHEILTVSFCNTVHLGTSGIALNNIYLNRQYENTRIDDGTVEAEYDNDPRFLRITVKGKKATTVHMVPWSNVAAVVSKPVAE